MFSKEFSPLSLFLSLFLSPFLQILLLRNQPQDEDQADDHVLGRAPLLELDVELRRQRRLLGRKLGLELPFFLFKLREPERAGCLEGSFEVLLSGAGDEGKGKKEGGERKGERERGKRGRRALGRRSSSTSSKEKKRKTRRRRRISFLHSRARNNDFSGCS